MLKEKYKNEVVKSLMKKFKYKNIYQVPKIIKVVVNSGLGEAVQDPKILDQAQRDIALITGQKPYIRRAKKSIASFKLRKGSPVGVAVTLRGNRAYEFLERLIVASLPRVRDFRGLSPDSVDGHGNYSFGISEHIVFPEIDYDKIERIFGLDISIVTSAKTDEECLELLRLLGFPLRGKKIE